MTGTAVAAAAMAALTASQAPGFELSHPQDDGARDRAGTALHDDSPGDDSYHTELPPLDSPKPPTTPPGAHVGDDSGIPATVLDAYKKAERAMRGSSPGCGLRWELLAAIGKVESGQARGGAVDSAGTTLKPILGPVLNGSGFARITDTDGGRWDGDIRYDRAVGPLQFIPSTWNHWGADGNGDGRNDPNNVYDAALAAGRYLCAGGRNLEEKADLDRAVLSYNNSRDYLNTVLAWYEFYRKGTHKVPDGSGVLPTSPGAGGTDDGGAGGGSASGGSHAGHTPSGKPSGSDSGTPGGGSHSSTPSDPPSSGTGTPGKPTPAGPAHMDRVGDGDLSARFGEDFATRPRVEVTDEDGKPVKAVRVRFDVVGATDARFGKADTATATTDATGRAQAPVLTAGDTAGSFTVTATVVGHPLPTVAFHATVDARADKLTRQDDAGNLTAKVDDAVAAGTAQVRASWKGKALAGLPLTATLISKADQSEPNTDGPYFTTLDGKKVRTLSGLKTGLSGDLAVPEISTDDHAGSYILRLATADGSVTLDIALTVTE